jgi:ATP-dependent Clp protease protease subunit
MSLVPIVIENSPRGERSFDIYSYLLRNRIIFLSGVIDDKVASSICAQLLFLEAEDSEKDIYLYINSQGGGINASFAIYDTMRFIKPDVHTVGMGLAASCGSFLLTAGTPGKRSALPNLRVMLHEPWGGYQGRSRHMEDHAKEIVFLRNKMIDIYHHHTGIEKSTIIEWLDRESFFSSEEALEYNLVDKIITNKESIILG